MDGESVKIGHQPPFGSEFVEGDVDAFAAGIGLATVQEFGVDRLVGDLEGFALGAEGALLELAYAIEMVGNARL